MAEKFLTDSEIKHARTMHKTKVHALQLAVAVALLGSWQLLADHKILDAFFYGRPSGVDRKSVV